jgi:hypothetical protein
MTGVNVMAVGIGRSTTDIRQEYASDYEIEYRDEGVIVEWKDASREPVRVYRATCWVTEGGVLRLYGRNQTEVGDERAPVAEFDTTLVACVRLNVVPYAKPRRDKWG